MTIPITTTIITGIITGKLPDRPSQKRNPNPPGTKEAAENRQQEVFPGKYP
jgi:hypothetical protein